MTTATAELAGITFATDNDYGVCHDLRETLAREYGNGNAGDGEGEVASRGAQFLRFAAVSDIATLRISTSPYDDEDMVIVDYGEYLGTVVANALRLRFNQAAYQLMASLEVQADQQAHHHNPSVSVTETCDPVGELPIY